MFATRLTKVVVALFATFIASISMAQQAQVPSQRFDPERLAPPSVHVPQNNVPPLRAERATSAAQTFNFSDTPATAFRNRTHRSVNSRADQSTRVARQVSFTEEVETKKSRLPEIPAILRERDVKSRQPMKSEADTSDKPGNAQVIHRLTPPANVDAATDRAGQIVVDQNGFQPPNLNQGSANTSVQQSTAELSNSKNDAALRQAAFTPGQNSPDSQTTESSTTTGVRSAEFNTTADNYTNLVRNVSGESSPGNQPAIEMASPGIRVQMHGPESIGINKNGIYKILVTNEGKVAAKSIQVGISMPASIELQNVNVSTGHHEFGNQAETAKLTWTIDRLPPGMTQTIAINAIPRTAEPFDMEVDWSFSRQQAASTIMVTQPQLEMKISGPTEVMFGEKVTYDVTILNPGTGDAEHVSVMLPQELGGEKASIGSVPAGGEKRFKVELLARTAGQLNLTATAVGDGNIEANANHNIRVRRANLNVAVEGPKMKYAGSLGQYLVTVTNDGDATASDVAAVFAMPQGVKYLGGINNVEDNESGLKWRIGTLTSGDQRTFKINCQLDASGNLFFQAGARGAGDLAATGECQTRVDTVADLTLDVQDPKGPLPTGENVNYKIVVRNRGTRSANGVNLVMQFSEGIEPVKADGFKNKIVTGQVIFAPISRIEPGQEIVLNVTAQAMTSGTHIFRGQLTCEESDSREIDEGTTRFFGEDVAIDGQLQQENNTADADSADELNDNDFK